MRESVRISFCHNFTRTNYNLQLKLQLCGFFRAATFFETATACRFATVPGNEVINATWHGHERWFRFGIDFRISNLLPVFMCNESNEVLSSGSNGKSKPGRKKG